MKVFSHYDTQAMCNIDYEDGVAIVGVMGDIGAERIVAMGRYLMEPNSDMAEVDFTVSHELQRKGVGSFLLHFLTEIAKANGIAGFYRLRIEHQSEDAECVLPNRLPSAYHGRGRRVSHRVSVR